MSIGNRRLHHLALVGLLLVAAVGCRQDMQDAPYYEEFELSDFFENGMVNQAPPTGTVARGFLKDDTHFWFGRDETGALVDTFPAQIDVSRELLERGRERYEIFCSVCHDQSGSGLGMIVRRGFKQPQPLYEDRLREQPIGYFYDVVTQGYGIMPSYAVQVPENDRWAIAAYIRVLQEAQGRQLDELPSDLQTEFRDGLEAAAAAASAAEQPAHHGGHGDDGHGESHGDDHGEASH